MLKSLIFATFFYVSAHGLGEFTILHHPSNIAFKGHNNIDETLLKEVYSASLGFTIEQDSNWPGMYITSPFNLAEAVVVVEIDGVSGIQSTKGHHFPLKPNSEANTYYSLKRRIEDRYPNRGSTFVNIDLAEGVEAVQDYDLFKSIKKSKSKKPMYGHLRNTVDEDREFLEEINLLNEIADKIETASIQRDFTPDLYWFRILKLHGLVDFHGENSTAAKEAKQLLNDVIMRLNQAFKKAYSGSVLVTVVISDNSHTRKTRNILATDDEKPPVNPLNLAKSYSANYPVIFNIFLWFGVVFVFSLLAIALATANMDPGRDSIIYRMTSTRMKKDN